MKRSRLIKLVLIILLACIPAIKFYNEAGANKITIAQTPTHNINNDNVVDDIPSISTSSVGATVNTSSKASILIDINDDLIYHSDNTNKSLPVYSVSKIMFLASLQHYLGVNNRSIDELVTVTDIVGIVNGYNDFSSAGLVSGQVFSIKELYDAVMLPSGNDAAILLAIEIFGSHQNAVDYMNKCAKLWKLDDSSFISTSGLDGEFINQLGIPASNGKNKMSVNDIVKLVKVINSDYKEIINSGSKLTSTIGAVQGNPLYLENIIDILDGKENGYAGVYGLKTGSNIEAGSNNIVSLMDGYNNQTYLAISLNSESKATASQDIINLFSYADSLSQ